VEGTAVGVGSGEGGGVTPSLWVGLRLAVRSVHVGVGCLYAVAFGGRGGAGSEMRVLLLVLLRLQLRLYRLIHLSGKGSAGSRSTEGRCIRVM
jgi:hypothetical protein